MRTLSNESNKSFELDMGALQGFLDSSADNWDDVFQSEIKEPDFEILKSFNDFTSHPPVATTAESPQYNVSRSQLPALSIFESSSSSREERSSSGRDTRITSGVGVDKQPISDQLRKITPSGQAIATVAGGKGVPMTMTSTNRGVDASTNHLPALSIFDTMASGSHRSKEEKSASLQQKEAASQPPHQVPKPSRGTEQKGTTESSQTPKMSPRPTRVITGRQGVSNRNGEVPFNVTGDAQPSGRTTISSIEPFDVQERRRILDFEDLYTAQQEGQMVGIGARSKVSTFASPAFAPNNQKRNAEDKSKSKTDARGKQRSGLILVPVTTANQDTNIALVSPVKEQEPEIPKASPETKKIIGSNKRAAPPSTETSPYEPVIAVANFRASPNIPRSAPQTNHREIRKPAPTSTTQFVHPTIPATSAPRNRNSTEPIYEAVICRKALEPQPEVQEPEVRESSHVLPGPDRRKITPPEVQEPEVREPSHVLPGPDRRKITPPEVQEPEVREPSHVLPGPDRIRKITPPSPITEEASEASSEEGQGQIHRAQSQGDSAVAPRDKGMLDPSIPIGRSLSEPAYFQNGRPLSPWERQSSSNSQEVEQEYRSLIDGEYD